MDVGPLFITVEGMWQQFKSFQREHKNAEIALMLGREGGRGGEAFTRVHHNVETRF